MAESNYIIGAKVGDDNWLEDYKDLPTKSYPLEKSTEKAVCVNINDSKKWIPKSIVVFDDTKKILYIPEWFYDKELKELF